jgi:hypothetical protein
MTPAEIMRELARDDLFPKAAMAAAGADREAMVPIFVDLIERLGSLPLAQMKDDDVMAVIPAFYLMGEWREPRAFRPLVHLHRLPTEVLDHLLGDAVTETSFRVVAGTFDGDLQPLFEAIDDPKADDFARGSLMSALVLIAQQHPTHRAAIEAHVRNFRSRCPEAPTDVLSSWTEVIADLGLESMTDEVRAAFDEGLIPEDYCDFSHFIEDMESTLKAEGKPTSLRYDKPLLIDAIGELSQWYCYSDAFFAKQKRHKVSNDVRLAPWSETFMHETAPVGRNDPCPCGSGKKYKKCCLQ